MTTTPRAIATVPNSDAASVRRCLDEYQSVLLEHPLLNRARLDLERGLAPGMPPQIVLLLGPTGVGKTTLVEALRRRVGPSDPRIVRVTCVPVASRRGYDFGRMHWRLLAQAADDPFSDDHVSPDAAGARLRSGRVRRDGPATTDEYRLGVLAMLRERGARAVVLDEAQHMTRVPSARSQADQLDVIKDCVDRTGITHVLVGTYELAAMVAPGDQLGRRSLVVHFAPYDGSQMSDRLAFERTFGQLVRALPFPRPNESWEFLADHKSELFLGSAGCVGILKEWLCRALQLVLSVGGGRLDWPVLEKTRLSDDALFVIADQIRAYRQTKRHTRQEIADALGLDRGAQAGFSTSLSSGPPQPGKRSPVRDRVGLPEQAMSG